MKPKNQYDYIANFFTGKDNLRPELMKPFEIENQLYATDAHTCIRFSKDLALSEYKAEKAPNAKNIFDKLDLTKSVSFDTRILLTKIYECEIKYDSQFKTCENCDGSGTCECDCCGNDADCKNCDGDGTIEIVSPFDNIKMQGEGIFIGGKKFNPKFIYKVIHVALILSTNFIDFHFNPDNNQGCLFVFDKVEILIMPMFQDK